MHNKIPLQCHPSIWADHVWSRKRGDLTTMEDSIETAHSRRGAFAETSGPCYFPSPST
jgi:hypothetical protein